MRPVNLHLPMKRPEDVIPHLGKGARHWKEGYSAQALATHWWRHNALPPDVARVLDTAEPFRGAELVDAFFERETALGDAAQGSQTDLMAVLGLAGGGLAVMGVEAKVNETFGKLIGEELAPGCSARKRERIARLCRILGLDPDDRAHVAGLRYQLLHRTCAVLFEAQRYHARLGVTLVETFSAEDAHWGEFVTFVRALGGAAEKGRLCEVGVPGGVRLWLGWCNSAAAQAVARA